MGPGWMMGGPGWSGGGFGIFAGLLMLFFLVLIIVGVVLLVRWLVKPERPRGAGDESALDILRKRYARGEIDREEFERMKADLQ